MLKPTLSREEGEILITNKNGQLYLKKLQAIFNLLGIKSVFFKRISKLKRYICIFVAFAMVFGCSSTKKNQCFRQWMKDTGNVKVLSTIGMIDDLVRFVGGDQVDCLCLIHGEVDPHSYELVKGDAEKFARADVVFANGLGLEHGASLQYQIKAHPKPVTIGDHLYRQCREELLVIDGQVDPHVWMDIALWVRAIDPIVQALSDLDPKHAADFIKRGDELRKQLLDVHSELYTMMQEVPDEKRFLVTSHDAFNYFARRYLAHVSELDQHAWKKRVAAPEGLAPDGRLSLLDIQEITAHLERYRIGVVFPESNVSKQALNKVIDACKKRGFDVTMIDRPLYGDSMGDSYVSMMRHNAQLIAQGLGNG